MVYRFRGVNYDKTALAAALDKVNQVATMQAHEVTRLARYNHANARTEYWDALSVATWIDTYCPGGLAGPAGQYLKVYFEREYGGRVSEASALHIIYDFTGPEDADERYIVRGGTDMLVSLLAARLPAGSVVVGMA